MEYFLYAHSRYISPSMKITYCFSSIKYISFLQAFQWLLNRDDESSTSKKSSPRSISMQKKVGLLVFGDKPLIKEAHVVFNTRNLTKSLVKITKIPPDVGVSKDNPTLKNNKKLGIQLPPHLRETPCLLSTHGLRRQSRSSMNLEELNNTVSVLPMTVCTKHGATSFLPLDYVKRMDEYTRTTRNHPVVEVVHRFNDCVLEFPFPPPIGSSEEQSSDIDFSRNCYQCFTPISERRSVYMYRDYLFCCDGCRLRACVTRFWYEKMMKSAEEKGDDFDGDDSICAVEKDEFFAILP